MRFEGSKHQYEMKIMDRYMEVQLDTTSLPLIEFKIKVW